MNTFPVSPELMQAFPLGALNMLVAVASTVAAQHGIEPARRLCSELARNEELWVYIAARLDAGRGDDAPTTERDPVPAGQVPAGEPATDAGIALASSPHSSATSNSKEPERTASEALTDLGVDTTALANESSPTRARRKARRRRSSKANGSGS